MNNNSRSTSIYFLLAIAPLITLGTLAGYAFSDVHNTYDFLSPVVGVLLLISVIGMFFRQLWALALYTLVCIGINIAVYMYYQPKDELDVAYKTLLVLTPFSLTAIYYWIRRSTFFGNM